jgi:leucyl aminopeptidase
VNWARRLILLPGSQLWPDELVKKAQEMVAASPSKSKIKAQYWGDKELRKNKFGGVLGVGQGSDHQPRFIVLEYLQGKKSDSPIVLVGKGITFDSGGLSLKPPSSQETMKYDMAGSASVMAAFKIATDLQWKVNLVVLVPTAENMPSGGAIRPGDILEMASGATVEVLNTDAEGRLILADALFYATTRYKPKAVIDVATLTGAAAMALGEAAVGIYSNSDKVEKALFESGARVQENLWSLPKFEDFYAPMLKSEIADLRNIGGREAGASTASIFLKHFVKNDTPWAHFDIAGCGWYDSPRDFISMKGPSGVPIRLLADFIEKFS